LRIKEHKTIKSPGGDAHQLLIIEYANRDWKVMINDNHIKQVTTVHLWDDVRKGWHAFAGRTVHESAIYQSIIKNEIAKLKYKVQ